MLNISACEADSNAVQRRVEAGLFDVSGSTHDAKIHSLPNSTIIKIFMCLVYMDHRLDYNWSWIAVTHVCRNWRGEALDDPLLWSWLPITHSRSRLEAYIIRSQSMPLTIDADICSHQNCLRCIEVLRFALEHLPRIRQLVLKAHIPSLQWSSLLQIVLAQPTPLLETFHLITPPFQINAHPLHLPNQFEAKLVPNLRDVLLFHCVVPWNSLILQNLTSLTINLLYYPYEGSDSPSVEEILNVLKACPKLQKLSISGLPTYVIASTSLPEKPIELPYLKDISFLGQDIKACRRLAENIKVPLDAVWHVSYSEPSIAHIESLIAIFKSARIGVSCDTLKITREARFTDVVAINNGKLQMSLRLIFTNISSDFNNANTEILVRTLVFVIREGFWSEAGELIYSCYSSANLEQRQWCGLLWELPLLQCIEIEFLRGPHNTRPDVDTLHGFVMALEPVPLYTPNEIQELMMNPEVAEDVDLMEDFEDMLDLTEELMCTCLQVVHFRNAEFSRPGSSSIGVPKELLQCLANRKRRDIPIGSFIFSSCSGIDDEHFDSLSKLVRRVEVNDDVWMSIN